MEVTTKKGDRGWTDLLFGGRVRKDDLRFDAVGTLDELNSFLGLAKCAARRAEIRKLIHVIQNDLFILCSELVTRPAALTRLEFRVDERRMLRLEEALREYQRKVPLKGCCFLIPGENESSARLDVCRTITRRAERLVVALRRRRCVPNRFVPVYLNRLSDLLYLLARAEEKKHRAFVARQA